MLPQEQREQQLVPEHNDALEHSDALGNVLEHDDAFGDALEHEDAFGDALEHDDAFGKAIYCGGRGVIG